MDDPMQVDGTSEIMPGKDRTESWGAVLAMSLCVFTLIASEFMPVSLLTPIASDLAMTEGQAGQAISVSGLFAVITSLSISTLTRNIDRKTVVLSLTVLMLLSGFIVAFAPNYITLMAGRAVIGMVIGGFWSMSAAIVMRLVREDSVPKALAILNGGNALAATVAAPLGSFLGGLVGWRGAFLSITPIAAVALVWLGTSLPSLRNDDQLGERNVFQLLFVPQVLSGMVALTLLFMGQFSLFTYLRPFLETVTKVDVTLLSFTLLVIGVSGLLGTILIGRVLNRMMYPALVVIPVLMAGIASALIFYGDTVVTAVLLFGAWGLVSTAAPVGWWSWLSRTLPRDAEAGGGLMVATIQFAITLGAALGGYLFDSSGYEATFAVSAGLLILAALFATLTYWIGHRN
jgi:predicted MFS family arabinose efflux permease